MEVSPCASSRFGPGSRPERHLRPDRFMGRKFVSTVIGALLLAVAWGARAAAQATGPKNPPLVISSMYGRDLFEFYCAPCHGRDAKGRGPVAAALKTAPADLTRITERSGGTFPTSRVESLVTAAGGVLASAHGSTEMPVWGPIFRALDPRDTLTTVRISNIVAYVASMQRK